MTTSPLHCKTITAAVVVRGYECILEDGEVLVYDSVAGYFRRSQTWGIKAASVKAAFTRGRTIQVTVPASE